MADLLKWLRSPKKKPKGAASTAAKQISEQKKNQKRAECASKQMEYDAVTGKCI